MDSIEQNRFERQVNNGHRGYTIKGKHVTRAQWLKSLVDEGFNRIEVEKRGICNVYTIMNDSNQLYQFKKKVEGEYLQALISDIVPS